MNELAIIKRKLEASEDAFFKKTTKLILQIINNLRTLLTNINSIKILSECRKTQKSLAALQSLITISEQTINTLAEEIEIVEAQLTDEIVGNLSKFQTNEYLYAVKIKFDTEISIIDNQRQEIEKKWKSIGGTDFNNIGFC